MTIARYVLISSKEDFKVILLIATYENHLTTYHVRGPGPNIAGLLQSQISVSSFRYRLNEYQKILATEW